MARPKETIADVRRKLAEQKDINRELAEEASGLRRALREKAAADRDRETEREVRHAADQARISALEEEAGKDSLTGLLTLKRMQERFLANAELVRGKGDKRHKYDAMSVIFADFDHFKTVNELIGHDASNIFLQTFASIVEQCCKRSGDIKARFGGDEFIIILSKTNLRQAKRKAEEIRKAVCAHPLMKVGGKVVSISQGVAEMDMSKPGLDALAEAKILANAAMYLAKTCGRNTVAIAEPKAIKK